MRGGGAWRPVVVWLVGVAGIVVLGVVGGMLVWSSRPPGNLELEGIAYGLGALAVGVLLVVGGWIALLVATVRHYVSEERRRFVLTRSVGAVGLLVLALGVLWPAVGQLDESGGRLANTWAGPVASVLVGLVVLAAVLLPAVLLVTPGRRVEVPPMGPASAPTWTPGEPPP